MKKRSHGPSSRGGQVILEGNWFLIQLKCTFSVLFVRVFLNISLHCSRSQQPPPSSPGPII